MNTPKRKTKANHLTFLHGLDPKATSQAMSRADGLTVPNHIILPAPHAPLRQKMARDISEWLEDLGLGKYADAFAENEIDLDALPHVTEDDLREIGIALGARRKLLAAIAKFEPNIEPTAKRETAGDRPMGTDAQRRQLTVMFVDLVGSTALSRRLDPEDLREVMRSYQDAVARAVARFDGHVAKFLGDGVLVYFGWPYAQEDQAERGVRAGLAAIRAVESLASATDEPLQARVGIATGLVVIGDIVGEAARETDAVVGETPNLAARLQDLAKPGAVVLNDITQRLTGRVFELEDLGFHRIKGFAEPVAAWRVAGERASEGRFEALHGAQLTPFVGRAEELALLMERWTRAKEGEGQLVLLSGEAGIGKSRITRMLMERLADEPHRRLRYQCSPYHTSTPLYPIIERLQQDAGIAKGDAAAVRLSKLEALLAGADDDPAANLKLFADLLSIDVAGQVPLEPDLQRRKRLTFEALIGRFLGLARESPVVMLFEDLHWADPTTLDLLSELATRTQQEPILAVMTFRPDFEVSWSGQPHVTTLALTRLTRRQSEAMVLQLTSGEPLPDPVMKQILDKTEGIPLFVEELTKEVLESGILARGEEGYTLAGPLTSLAIPSSLQDSLMARLDRLTPVREVAQIGAVIGREFPHALLARVTEVDANELNEALTQLTSAELIFRRGTPPDATYVFKHALVQDAAYKSLLNTRRRQLHQTIAQLLESDSPEIARVQPELLAEHFTEAGLAEEAIDYWLRAGRHSAARGAYVEAIRQLTKGLELLATLPDGPERARTEIDIRVALGVPLLSGLAGASAEAEQNYLRAQDLCNRTGEIESLFPVLFGLWMCSMLSSDMPRMCRLADELLVLGQRQPDTGRRIEAHHCQWTSRFLGGELAAALEHAENGMALYRSEEHHQLAYTYGGHDPGTCCRNVSAFVLCMRGYLDQARQRIEASLTLSRQFGHSTTLADTLNMFIQLAIMLRDYAAIDQPNDELFELASSENLQDYVAILKASRGYRLVERDQHNKGLSLIRESLPHVLGQEFGWTTPLVTEIVSVLGRTGSADEARDLIRRALELAESKGLHWWDAELHRVKGELSLPGDPDDAETSFERALDIARLQDARFLELRTATSLAGLWHAQGRTADARSLLAPLYSWFTEGLGASDFKEAKALLDALG
jgi:class 3 adenylate cyclase/tetratricopeptide (TPR) repeat protein